MEILFEVVFLFSFSFTSYAFLWNIDKKLELLYRKIKCFVRVKKMVCSWLRIYFSLFWGNISIRKVLENIKGGKNLIYWFTKIFCFLRKLNFFDNIINRIEKYVNFNEKDEKKPPRSILTIHDLLIKVGQVYYSFSINYVLLKEWCLEIP